MQAKTTIAVIIAAAFFGFILWVIYLANTSQSSVFFELVAAIPYGDKVGHAGLFGTLTALLGLATRLHGFHLGKIKLYTGAIAVSVFVIAEEFSQAFIPSRTFDFTDLSADAVGILLAVLLLRKIEMRRQVQITTA